MAVMKQPKNTVPFTEYIKVSLSLHATLACYALVDVPHKSSLCSLVLLRFVVSQIAFSYIGAMYSSNLALMYMSYPAQSLLKSSKMVPVMLMRIVTVGQRYTLQEYFQVFVITAGICSFMLFEDGAKSGKETSLIGLSLCIVSLILDGFTGPTQERINAQHKPSMAQMMFFLNFWAILFVLALLLITGQLWTGLRFFTSYPEVLPEVAIFSLLSALGQAAILVTVLNFNSLILTTITTSDSSIHTSMPSSFVLAPTANMSGCIDWTSDVCRLYLVCCSVPANSSPFSSLCSCTAIT